MKRISILLLTVFGFLAGSALDSSDASANLVSSLLGRPKDGTDLTCWDENGGGVIARCGGGIYADNNIYLLPIPEQTPFGNKWQVRVQSPNGVSNGAFCQGYQVGSVNTGNSGPVFAGTASSSLSSSTLIQTLDATFVGASLGRFAHVACFMDQGDIIWGYGTYN